MALRIKELLYEDQYTIAGAKKRLTNDLRGGKIKTTTGEGGEGYTSPTLATEKSTAQRLSKVANARLASSDGIRRSQRAATARH
jgi:hypothetical protein